MKNKLIINHLCNLSKKKAGKNLPYPLSLSSYAIRHQVHNEPVLRIC